MKIATEAGRILLIVPRGDVRKLIMQNLTSVMITKPLSSFNTFTNSVFFLRGQVTIDPLMGRL